ncbi:MAG: helix-turn-helix domain-containing protein [Limimaricola sp.]|nr:helix-turn-helix domain-containing protein [Limimaricola sp.]
MRPVRDVRTVSQRQPRHPARGQPEQETSINVQQSPFAQKLGAYVALTEAEFAVLAELHTRRRTFVADRDVIYEGQSKQSAYILARGWACSYKLLPNGARQIVDFQIPGDFLGLRSVLFRIADHNVEPVTLVEASEVLVSDLIDAFSRTPRLATAVLWAASRDEAMVVEHLVNIGRRDAVERTAHFLLELGARLMLVGLGTKDGYDCPLSQYLLADALGLSAVHVNRSLRQLREKGLLTFRDGKVVFDDFDGLVALADFDQSYLDQSGPLLR